MAKMVISMIAAMDKNNAIGFNNELLWHLPDDFKWFKEKTKDKAMIMGRNTMVSLGKPLKNRMNIVLSSSTANIPEGFVHAYNYEEALTLIPDATEELMIIGGGKIYDSLLHLTTRLYITRVHHIWPSADTFFPQWDLQEWEQTYTEHHPADERHLYAFDFEIWERVSV